MEKELKIKISVDKKTGAIAIANSEFDGLSRSIKKTDKNVNTFGTSLSNIAKTAGGVYLIKQAFDLATGSLKALVDTASDFEQQKSILKTLEGDSTKAQESLKWIEDFTKKTPYELANVTDAFVKARAYGLDPLNGGMKTLGDTASGMGKSIDQAVEAMADAVTGENERLKEFGVKAKVIGDEVAYNWTDTSGKAKHIVVENNSKIIESTLEAIFNSKYAGAMEEQSKTYAGMISNMSDEWTLFKKELMKDGAFTYIKAVVKTLGDTFSSTYANILANSTTFTNGVNSSIKSIIRGLGTFANALEGISIFAAIAWNTIKAGFNALVVGIVGGAADLIDVLNKLPGVKIDNSWSKQVAADAADSFRKNIDDINKSFDGLVDYEAMADGFLKATDKNFKMLSSAISTEVKKPEVKGAKSGSYKSSSSIEKATKAPTTSLSSWESYYETIGDYETAWLLKASTLQTQYTDLSKEQYAVMYNAAKSEYFDKLNNEKIDIAITGIDDSTNSMTSLLDSQIALAESGMDWSNSLDGVAGNIAGIAEAFMKVDVSNMKFEKADIKLHADYQKALLKAGTDKVKQDKITTKYSKDKTKLDKKNTDKEIDNYANIAGAAASMFSEKTAAYKALHAVETGIHAARLAMNIAEILGMTTKTTAKVATDTAQNTSELTKTPLLGLNAILAQGSVPILGFALMASMAALVLSFGGFASGGGGSTKSEYEINKENIEAEYAPILDKLDRQIDLLESIDRNGSASALGVGLASAEFEKSYKLYVEDELESFADYIDFRVFSRQGLSQDAYIEELAKINESFNNALFSITSTKASGATVVVDEEGLQGAGTQIRTNRDVLREGYNLIEYFGLIVESQYGQIQALGDAAGNWGAKMHTAGLDYQTSLSTYYDLISEYAGSLIDINNDLTDASETMKESFDAITGTARYELEDLTNAFNDFDSLRGESSYSSYLEGQIVAIEKVNAKLDGGLIDLLLLEDPAKIQEQRIALDSLGESLGVVFDDGARGALDYIESIELVSEAMETSRENIKDFQDSFKTDEQLALDISSTTGIALATTEAGLTSLFESLSKGIDGLTDLELELLEANKELIDSNKENIKSFVDSFKTEQQLTEDMAVAVGVTLATTQDGLVDLFTNLSKGLGGLTDSELELLEANKDLIDSDLDEYIEGITSNISTLESVLGSLNSVIEKLKDSALGSTYTMDNFYASMSETLELSKTDNYEGFEEALNKTIGYSDALFDVTNFGGNENDMEFAQLVAAAQFEGMEVTALKQIDYLKMIEENTNKSNDLLALQLENLGKDISESLSKIPTQTNSVNNTAFITEHGAHLENSTDSLVNSFYEDLLGRGSEQGGLDHWTDKIETGAMTAAQVQTSIMQSDEYKTMHGSHRDGLGYVPFDGYRAELHEGEAVLTKQENVGGFSAVVAELRELRKTTQLQNNLIAQQANEIKTLRKESEDQSALLADIEEKIA